MIEYCAVIGPALYRAAQQTAVKEVTRPLPSVINAWLSMQKMGIRIISIDRINFIFKLNMIRTYLKQCHLHKLVLGLFFQTLLVQLHLITFALVEAIKLLTEHAVAFDSGLPL